MLDAKKPTVFINLAALKRMKDEGAVNEENLNALRAMCDDIISKPTLKVTASRLLAPSKNPHDYMSMGTYWWPNPDTPDGLPYVRRDGYANPDVKDKNFPGSLFPRCLKLALGAFYFDDDRYAEFAEQQLYDWFLNPDTYMAPHGKYVQAIPGICDGRGVGLIDFHHSYYLMDAVRILEAMGKLDESVTLGVENWFSTFTDWMLTTEIGVNERNARNNHGSWYDSQIITAAVFCNRPELVKDIATTSYTRRILPQINERGEQPHELARTMACIYSLFNLKAMLSVARVAARIGVDTYLTDDAARGHNVLRRAVDFIGYAAQNIDSLPYQEINKEGIPGNLAEVLLESGALFNNPEYTARGREMLKVGDIYNYFPQDI